MKHDHKKTKKLKVALFSIVMLLPCLAVGITCLTHVFNKEVAEDTQTATINYMYETENPQQTGIHLNNIYHIEINNDKLMSTFGTQNYYKMQIINGTIKINNQNYYAVEENTIMQNYNQTTLLQPKIYLNIDTNNTFWIDYYYTENEYISFDLCYTNVDEINLNANIVMIDFDNAPPNTNNAITQCNNIPIESVTINTITQDHTTNIFYDSCEQVKDSFVLNWCNPNNPISQPIISFTNVFSLPNDHIINTLLTYWFSISMIYIVIDIIIECIIYITHFFNKEQ